MNISESGYNQGRKKEINKKKLCENVSFRSYRNKKMLREVKFQYSIISASPGFK